jgi:hypothetical protein
MTFDGRQPETHPRAILLNLLREVQEVDTADACTVSFALLYEINCSLVKLRVLSVITSGNAVI